MKLIVCGLVLSAIICALAEEEFADNSARIAYKLYEDCTNDIGISVCLKKKAIGLLDRLGRMENVTLGTGINIVRQPNVECNETVVNEKEIEQNLPRALDDKEDALSYMLMDKLFQYIGSRKLEVSLPQFDAREIADEARKGDLDIFGGGGGGGGKKGGGKKKKKGGGMMNMMMALIGTKLAAFMGLKTIMTFLIATKALIIGKLALILSGVMLFRKFMMGNGKNAGNSASMSHGGAWDSSPSFSSSAGSYGGGGSGGWQSGGWNSGGGGYDRRSYDAQELAYNSYSTTQK